MTCLDIVAKLVGGNLDNLGGGILLWGVDQFVLWEIPWLKKLIRQHFMLHVTTSETWQNQYWLKTWFSLANNHVEFANDTIYFYNIKW